VAFVGQATISDGRSVTLSRSRRCWRSSWFRRRQGQRLRTGKAYVVSSQVIVHRPLVAFETVEVVPLHTGRRSCFAFGATFGIYYSAAKDDHDARADHTQAPA
jgi:hypothetical protein